MFVFVQVNVFTLSTLASLYSVVCVLQHLNLQAFFAQFATTALSSRLTELSSFEFFVPPQSTAPW